MANDASLMSMLGDPGEPLVFKKTRLRKCKHCGKSEGNHDARHQRCPLGAKHRTLGYTQFCADQWFAPIS